jgi:hypothetical protein
LIGANRSKLGRETKLDRAFRRARKLRLRLGCDPADDEYPDKPPLMRWTTYNRLLDKLRAADGIADERLRRVLINAQMSGFGGEAEFYFGLALPAVVSSAAD